MEKRAIDDSDTIIADPAFRADVLDGLAAPQRAVPARWLHDRRGSELFEAITDLPEYYPTRTETRILTESGADIAAKVRHGRAVVEFGSGSSAKTPLLLRAIAPADRKSVVQGKRVSVRVDLGGRRILTKKRHVKHTSKIAPSQT